MCHSDCTLLSYHFVWDIDEFHWKNAATTNLVIPCSCQPNVLVQRSCPGQPGDYINVLTSNSSTQHLSQVLKKPLTESCAASKNHETPNSPTFFHMVFPCFLEFFPRSYGFFPRIPHHLLPRAWGCAWPARASCAVEAARAPRTTVEMPGREDCATWSAWKRRNLNILVIKNHHITRLSLDYPRYPYITSIYH